MKPRTESSERVLKHVEPFRGSFVGRDGDIAGIEQLVAGGARLVTLLGPGGVGKTRLLHRLTRQLGDAYRITLWCDLSGARSSADVIASVAAAASGLALGAASTARAAIEQVGRALLRRGPCLLALDNLEQLEEAALPPLVRWISDVPSLVVVTTSRVRLGMAGEVVHHVGPLSLAEPASGSSDAMRLFEDRAMTVRPAFAAEERAAVGRIVALLDGIPLALEMAAARLAILAPDELLERLSRPLSLLSSSARADPDRHASLSRVLDESWELLGEAERRTLAELGVFVGGFTMESAEAVVSASDAIASIQRLVDSSLVRGVPSRTRRKRSAPYEVVREYALARLAEDGRLSDVRLRHAAHFASWGSARLAHMSEGSLHELVDDEANLIAAAAFARSMAIDPSHVSSDAGALHLRLLAVLEPVRMLRGQLDEWAQQLRHSLHDLRERPAPPALRAPAQLALARALHELGRPDSATIEYEAALVDARAANDASLEGLSLAGFGRLIAGLGRWEEACSLFAVARALPNASPIVRKFAHACYEFYGTEIGLSTDVVSAVADYVATCRHGGDPRELVFWLVQLGRSESELVRAEANAEAHLDEAVALARRLGDLRGEGYALFGLGSHHMGFGRFTDAVEILEQGARLLREAGTRRYEAWAIGFQGTSYASLGAWPSAITALDEAIRILGEVGDAPREAHLLAFRGAVRARLDDEARASTDFARADELAPAKSRYHAWTIDLCKGQLDVLAARNAIGGGDAHEGPARLARAQALLGRAGWPAGGCAGIREWPWGNEFFEPRLAAAMLERAIRDAQTARNALLVAADGSFFVLPSGQRVVSGRRGKLQRILVVLARGRIERAGQAVTSAALVDAAWPGERMRPNAAKNRLHVALDTLRKLGLRDVLVRGEAGWLLDPQIPCAWAAPEA